MPAPSPSPFPTSHIQPAYPALYLYPLNESFVPKHISLYGNQRVKIGRQTNAKTIPGERNGFFDSKVLSRQHAEIWEDSGKIFIKDVKSSNGTFINGERLSPEGVESEKYELKSDDIVEFGIDIVGEDNKTIIHHKVAARIVCIFNEQDAQVAARAEQHQQSQASLSHHPGSQLHSGGTVGSFNFAAGPGPAAQRRPPMQQAGIAGMGSLGGSMRPPGKSGLTFDHILSRLQGELQKSRDTGAELHNLNGALNEIHDTLGGSLPQNLPPPPHSLPPVRPPPSQDHLGPSDAASASQAAPSAALAELHSQLRETQSSLEAHVNKIRDLENLLKEQEMIKREVSELRDIMEGRQRTNATDPPSHPHSQFDTSSDDDDAQSIATVIAHELESVAEEDESALDAEEEEDNEREPLSDPDLEDDEHDDERRRRRDELGRPRTPEPTGMGMNPDMFDGETEQQDRSATLLASPRPASDDSSAPISSLVTTSPTELTTHGDQINKSGQAPADVQSNLLESLNARLITLSTQFEGFLALTTSLQAQHGATEATINALHAKVSDLEERVKMTQAQQETALAASAAAVAAAAASAKQAEVAAQAKTESERKPESEREAVQTESVTAMLAEWKKGVEVQWSTVREEWAAERARLARAADEWEARAHRVDANFASLESQVASSSKAGSSRHLANGHAHHELNGRTSSSGGLVTPPSPRSRSADSGRSRRRRRSGSSRGRSRSRSPGTSDDATTDSTSATSVSQAGDEAEGADAGKNVGEDVVNGQGPGLAQRGLNRRLGAAKQGSGSLITPASSVHMHIVDGEVSLGEPHAHTQNYSGDDATSEPPTKSDVSSLRRRNTPASYVAAHPIPSTALGVLVIGVAAAVIWNTKLRE